MNTVFPYKSKRDWPAKRGQRRIAKGEQLYAVKSGQLFFIWSYTSRDFAETMAAKVAPQGPVDIAANWRESVWACYPSTRESFK